MLSSLVANEQISTVGIHLREPLPNPASNATLICSSELVNRRFTFERDPFVCLKLRKVGCGVEVVADVLTKGTARRQQQKGDAE